MRLYELHTRVINQESNLVDELMKAIDSQGLRIDTGDVLGIASKVVATVQKRLVKLDSIHPSLGAKRLAQRLDLEPSFVEVVLQEADEVYGGVLKAILTLKDSILTPNAGVDHKNAPLGYVVLWPKSPYKAAERIREEMLRKTGKRVGVLIVDSRVTPLRNGTTGLALALSGFEPVIDHTTERDLFDKAISITRHAVADDLASAAHLLMGESAEQTPAVLIKGAPLKLSEKVDPESNIIPSEKDLFRGLLRRRKMSRKH